MINVMMLQVKIVEVLGVRNITIVVVQSVKLVIPIPVIILKTFLIRWKVAVTMDVILEDILRDVIRDVMPAELVRLMIAPHIH